MQEYELERGSWLDLCEHVQSRILSRGSTLLAALGAPEAAQLLIRPRATFFTSFHGPYLNPLNFLSRESTNNK